MITSSDKSFHVDGINSQGLIEALEGFNGVICFEMFYTLVHVLMCPLPVLSLSDARRVMISWVFS